MVRIQRVTVAAVLVVGCGSMPERLIEPAYRPSLAVASRVHIVGVDGLATSECGREDVLVAGTLQLLFAATENPDGSYHLNEHFLFVGKGTGVTTGTRYVARQNVNYTITVRLSESGALSGSAETQILTFTLVNLGGGQPTETLTFLFHITTIDSEGTVTAFIDSFRVKC